ncbi:hypothetical protein [Nocardioides sp. AE5]|uniref:hypothetical protein n=1 Tax=Nocardioides sp. AE5 TaxID=2962573 RepID=UPI002881DAF1|nr:hypothetical protein [Nocardioides sp. AE5]MDT0202224.1 hypothetical protein [Nocardioides sp. AE5]
MPRSVRAGLPAGEDVLAWESVALAWGESRLGRTEPPKAIQGVDLDPVTVIGSGPLDVDPGLFERWLGGISLTGHRGSVAESLAKALESTSNPRLCVTTARLLVFAEGSTTFGKDPATGAKTWDAETDQVWALPTATVRGAERASRPLMAGRLLLRFADASTVALMCGMFSTRPANRLREALVRTMEG